MSILKLLPDVIQLVYEELLERDNPRYCVSSNLYPIRLVCRAFGAVGTRLLNSSLCIRDLCDATAFLARKEDKPTSNIVSIV